MTISYKPSYRNFSFLTFSHFPQLTVYKWSLGHAWNNFLLSISSFVTKTKPRVKNFWFCRTYGRTISFKINDVAGTIFLDAISGHDWQPSWILRPLLRSTLFVTTNWLRCITRINIHLKLNIVNLWWIGAGQWKIIWAALRIANQLVRNFACILYFCQDW